MDGGGGGPEFALRSALISAVMKLVRRSMNHDGFETPLGVLLLSKGGGSGMNIPYGGPLVTYGMVLLVQRSHPPPAA
jgi:hypothetical protein